MTQAGKQAIAELESQEPVAWELGVVNGVVTRRPVARPQRTEQEPVAYLCEPDANGLFGLPTPDKGCKDCFPVYLHSQRTWVGLTDEEIKTICLENGWDSSWQSMRFAHAIEAKLKKKNT
jgi:hypothetical protein